MTWVKASWHCTACRYKRGLLLIKSALMPAAYKTVQPGITVAGAPLTIAKGTHQGRISRKRHAQALQPGHFTTAPPRKSAESGANARRGTTDVDSGAAAAAVG